MDRKPPLLSFPYQQSSKYHLDEHSSFLMSIFMDGTCDKDTNRLCFKECVLKALKHIALTERERFHA